MMVKIMNFGRNHKRRLNKQSNRDSLDYQGTQNQRKRMINKKNRERCISKIISNLIEKVMRHF